MKTSPQFAATTAHPPAITRGSPMREAAVQLEATFLAEMLKSAGLGKSPQGFGGGAGEDQFASMLVRQQAEQMARAGGVGLSEALFDALMERRNEE